MRLLPRKGSDSRLPPAWACLQAAVYAGLLSDWEVEEAMSSCVRSVLNGQDGTIRISTILLRYWPAIISVRVRGRLVGVGQAVRSGVKVFDEVVVGGDPHGRPAARFHNVVNDLAVGTAPRGREDYLSKPL